jgi:uncharacterized membrane protein YhaH (DUF805 family)
MTAAKAQERLARLVPCFAILVVACWIPLLLPPHHSFDDAEPEILNGAYRLARGLPLYHGLEGPPWVITPYPPLYTGLVALAVRLTSLSFLPGRLISLLSTLCLAWAFVVLARRWGGKARDGLFAFALVLLIPAGVHNAFRPHPQMFAVALSVAAFVTFGEPSLPWVVSPVLAVLACYAKQTQIALPLATGFFLLTRDRPRLARYALSVVILGLVPFLVLEGATDGAFFESIGPLAVLPYSLLQVFTMGIQLLGFLLPFHCLAFVRLRDRVRRGELELLDVYLVAVVLVTIPTLGRAGAYTQYVLELVVVEVLYLLRTGGFAFPAGWERFGVVQLLALFLYGPAFVLVQEGSFDRASNKAAPEVRALLETVPGPILTQQGSFSLFTRGEIHIQLFHFVGLARLGRWDEGLILGEVRSRALAWVVTESPLEGPLDTNPDRERFTPELWEALGANYERRALIGPYYVYAPRGSPAATARTPGT